jgi:YARHG domain
MRNTIHKKRGYCFHTPRAIKAFGNAGCLYDDVSSVPLNSYERANISAIKQAETSKGFTVQGNVPSPALMVPRHAP